jgi:hypothetical protein
MRPLPRRYADYERAKREYAPAVLPKPEPPSPMEVEIATLRRELAEARKATELCANGHARLSRRLNRPTPAPPP